MIKCLIFITAITVLTVSPAFADHHKSSEQGMPADSKAHKETMEDHAGKTAKAKNEDEHEDAMESDQESMSNKPMGAMSKNEKASGLEKQADKKMAQLDKKGDKKGDKGKPMPENSKKWWKFWED